MNPAPPVMRIVPVLASGALRMLQCQFEFLRQRLHRGAAALPCAIGLELQVADAARAFPRTPLPDSPSFSTSKPTSVSMSFAVSDAC